jgi:hypothetical protein
MFRPLLLAAPLALLGQTAVLRTHLDRDARRAPTPATLLLLDVKGSHALEEGFTALLRQEALRAYAVPVKCLALGSGAETDLLNRLHEARRPQWLLVDRQDRVLARGEALPDAARLEKVLESAGFRDLAKELRAYLKREPDSVDARERLITLLRRRAEDQAARYLGLQPETARDRLDQGDLAGWQRGLLDPTQADLRGAKPLDAVQDLDAWGAFAQELDAAFRTGLWREMDFPWTREGRPLDAASPTLRVVYGRWQPTVEASLRRSPESEPFWSLWLWMNAATGGARLRPLLATLEPSPLTPKDQWPPDPVTRALLRASRSPDDFRALKELYLARWEALPHPLREASKDGPRQEQDWDAALAPLLECCLRAGDRSQADTLFLEALTASQWKALPSKGAALAKACGAADLAARWGALRP